MDEQLEFYTQAERERYERVRARIGVGSLPSDQHFRERNAVAASMASISGKRKSRSTRPGRTIWGRDA